MKVSPPRSRRAQRTIPLKPLAATVAWPVGMLTLGAALMMLVSAAVGAAVGASDGASHLGLSAAITAAIGGGLMLAGRDRAQTALGRREALLIVSLSWITLSLVGSLPFLIGAGFSVPDAIFEATSGFTTTGATTLSEIRERLNPALHFWRTLSHWLGGMGIVVLFVAVFPALGVGGKHLFRSEVPGPRSQGLTPRIRQTSSVLWRIYLLITAVQTLLLWLVGLPPLEALMHAFSTMGTGGFSSLNGSVGGMEATLGVTAAQAAAAQWIILVFMVLSGMNFGLFHQVVRRGPGVILRHTETRVYLGVLALAGVAVSAALLPGKLTAVGGVGHALHEATRDAFFHLASVATTTGFSASDYGAWPTFGKMLLLGLFFTGGCSGSTAGGMKVIRWIILFKATAAELRRSYRPHLISPVRVGRQVISQQHLREILAFSGMFLATVGIGAAAVALLQSWTDAPIDGTTAVMASLACVSNVGPGLGLVGPLENYGFFSGASKLVLSACMLLGRLEFLTLLAIFTPGFWRR